ncbi:hypothetical protein [Roseateles koreensis]|uniref:Uncharacterized protein n=1 Tax=Roseateles koreensis TaxID=2987526 RepID=A0ABT5KTM5_9BURK|nr:hypothetical protein [Roseateles koreensis]MDC8786283.1 hypothetical protein [Roseateles koreensis]
MLTQTPRIIRSVHPPELAMPQVFNVGYRSPLVNGLAWLLMILGLLGLGLCGYLLGFSAAGRSLAGLIGLPTLTVISGLAIAAGQALLRRYEWGRRLSLGLLLACAPSLPALPWLTGSHLMLAVVYLGLSASLLWAAARLNSRGVRQEFA